MNTKHARFRPRGRFVLLICLAFLGSTPVSAQDRPAPRQSTGWNTDFHVKTVEDTDPATISDAEFAQWLCDAVKNGGFVDVKIVLDFSHSGGFLDDIQRVFGPNGPCRGIPWVAAAATGWKKAAQDYGRGRNSDRPDPLGTPFTDGVTRQMSGEGNKNVQTDFLRGAEAAKNLMKPQGTNMKREPHPPVVASGNGGSAIAWDGTLRHRSLIMTTDPNTEGSKGHINHSRMSSGVFLEWAGVLDEYERFEVTRDGMQAEFNRVSRDVGPDTQLFVYLHGSGSKVFKIPGTDSPLTIEEETSFLHMPEDSAAAVMSEMFLDNPSRQPRAMILGKAHANEDTDDWEYGYNTASPTAFPRLPDYVYEDLGRPLELPVNWFQLRTGYAMLDIIPKQDDGPTGVRGGPGKDRTEGELGLLTISDLELRTQAVPHVRFSDTLLPAQSGAYYDPNRSGEGLFIELLEGGKTLAYFFGYDDDGNPFWALGLGDQLNDGFHIPEMLIPTGPEFGPNYDPGDRQFEVFGALTMKFGSCGAGRGGGRVYFMPRLDLGLEPFNDFNYHQLTEISSCFGDWGQGSENRARSGSWYDPSTSGEGVILQVLVDGTVVVQWFTYDFEGNQMWIQGTGMIENDVLTVTNLFRASGPSWGLDFDPGALVTEPWGELTMTFSGCDAAAFTYDSAQFGTGSRAMIRLTVPAGMECDAP